MEFVLGKIKWHLERSQRGKARTFFALFPDDAFSVRVVMEVGNGNTKTEYTEVEAITFEAGGLHSKRSGGRTR